ncbi:TetR/AcrR family transcriptional regulator [Speluncibacter jeojiensis]|uniref:TetR family transcriptional regulator C-terminal domain-containing protein n=1 Tax=Speluncibacter jeojiensis TaxID=2710754 RepID=A0A9X4RDB8_9ACTN|nr:TetR family transcriptional regulator C-terminal domain-containing protein [Rhodococcus sp. D2-41]MDG3014002.1 TetR family transcriptional regulator C-terminal domain-containing protein [Corynebacteriales bacterium D3-21]
MPRVKKDAADRREDILNATLETIEEKGIDQLRGADLAKRLGVSAGLIFYHFDNLENLVISAIRFAADQDMNHLRTTLEGADGDTTTRVRAVLHEYGPTGAAFGWRLWIESWSASLRNPELRKVIRTLDAGWRDVLTDLIDAGTRSGEFTCPDPSAAAWRLTSLLDGLTVQQVVFDEAVTADQVADWMDLAMSRELGI